MKGRQPTSVNKLMYDRMPTEPCMNNGECEHYKRCSTEKICCYAFKSYVLNSDSKKAMYSDNEMHIPNKRIYRELFHGRGDK